eukprot:CAMPEP_0194048470 /NCGR_PEP_ID=MMETSP0009_2-20130614/27374_1 /TAXON_ID=210454 /ORGANISM="Grammatophora oceanica, Strain CCMP 410" /LENGTH=205 /DNA_ID=CAMNT_0038694333 /DNA_START=65 /DNA_END=682 /DNA_ORIENTATION=+
MRSFAILLSLNSIFHGVVGFSHVVPTALTSRTSTSALFAITHHHDSDINPKEMRKVDNPLHNIASIAATLALGWTLSISSSIAYDCSPPPTTEVSSSITSTSVQLAGGGSYSDSDFADFSLPSYRDVAAAEINTNLKGGTDLLGDEFKAASSSSTGAAVISDAPAKNEPTAADIKAEKAAAKAAQKAARERQQAAVEAAAAAANK